MNITVFRVYQLNLLTAISMYMKSLFYLFLSIVGAWLFSSCSDDFLGETETTDLDQATVFADSTYTADFLNQIYVDIGFDIQHNRYKISIMIMEDCRLVVMKLRIKLVPGLRQM